MWRSQLRGLAPPNAHHEMINGRGKKITQCSDTHIYNHHQTYDISNLLFQHHCGAVVSAVAPQQEGPGFENWLGHGLGYLLSGYSSSHNPNTGKTLAWAWRVVHPLMSVLGLAPAPVTLKWISKQLINICFMWKKVIIGSFGMFGPSTV